MIGLDTNVLARYIMQDDPAQSEAASELIESRCSADEPGLVSSVVLCELVWVLGRGYRVGRPALAKPCWPKRSPGGSLAVHDLLVSVAIMATQMRKGENRDDPGA